MSAVLLRKLPLLACSLMLTQQLTLDGEFAYRHSSNAHFAERNLGTNAIGGLVGVSYAF